MATELELSQSRTSVKVIVTEYCCSTSTGDSVGNSVGPFVGDVVVSTTVAQRNINCTSQVGSWARKNEMCYNE